MKIGLSVVFPWGAPSEEPGCGDSGRRWFILYFPQANLWNLKLGYTFDKVSVFLLLGCSEGSKQTSIQWLQKNRDSLKNLPWQSCYISFIITCLEPYLFKNVLEGNAL